MSVQTARECFQSLKTGCHLYHFPGIHTCFFAGQAGGQRSLRQTDDIFWRVFDFSFIEGKPYDKAVFDAGQPAAVLRKVARSLVRPMCGRDVNFSSVMRPIAWPVS